MEKLITVLISKADAKLSAKKQAFMKVVNAKLDSIYLTTIKSSENRGDTHSDQSPKDSVDSQIISTICLMAKSFAFDTIKIMYTKHMNYDDFEMFVDGLMQCLFSMQNLRKLQITKASDILSFVDSVAEGEEHHNESDSEDEKVFHITVQEKLNRKLIFTKNILKSCNVGCISENEELIKKESIYQIQPIINRLINLKECKETLLIIPSDNKEASPSASVLNETLTFINNLVELFASFPEAIPTTLNIEHYMPIWLSFCNMKACETTSNILIK